MNLRGLHLFCVLMLTFAVTVCSAQTMAVSSTATTGLDITLATSSSNYELYDGNPSLWGQLQPGGYAQFKLQSNTGGTFTTQIYYSNGTPTAGTAQLLVNGASPINALLPSTTDWSIFQLSAPVVITLPAGISTFTVSSGTTFQAFNLAGVNLTPLRIAPSPLQSVLSAAPLLGNNPLSGLSFYVNPYSAAATNVTQSCSNGQSIAKIAAQPQGVWFGNWNTNPQADVSTVMQAAAAQGTVPVLVAYNIVNRDCGGFSSGGSPNDAAYQSWIQGVALGVGNGQAVVILEPDSLTQYNTQGCLSQPQQNERLSLLQYAVSMFKQHAPNAMVYMDGGPPNAINPLLMAQALTYGGVANATGFAVNTSNYESVTDSTVYGQQVSALIGGKHFVIDTSRDGVGATPDHQWCNPMNRGLGEPPQGFPGGLVDGWLWVQNPGESDGQCNGGPPAGQFSNAIACTLLGNSVF
jgi:endoglucanase